MLIGITLSEGLTPNVPALGLLRTLMQVQCWGMELGLYGVMRLDKCMLMERDRVGEDLPKKTSGDNEGNPLPSS